MQLLSELLSKKEKKDQPPRLFPQKGQLSIKGQLINGRIICQPVGIQAEDLELDTNGGAISKNYPHPCFLCGGHYFYIVREDARNPKGKWISFCGKDGCMGRDPFKNLDSFDCPVELFRKPEPEFIPQLPSKSAAERFEMGKEFHEWTMSNYEAPQDILENIMAWVKDSRTFLCMMGSTGARKTTLCAAMLNYLDDVGENVYYTTNQRLLEDMKRANSEGRSEYEIIAKLADCKYLILDDLGSTTGTDWQIEKILDLIDRRYSDRKKTLVTTNLDHKGLELKVGIRTASRILDKRNLFIYCFGGDYRQNPELFEGKK